MFFEKEMISFNILDVLWINNDYIEMYNSGRNFSALSFRYRADTVLKTATGEYHLRDNSVSYFPARLDYSRTSKKDEMIVIHFETTNYHTKDIEYFQSENPERLSRLFKEILDVWTQKKVGYRLRCAAILYEILAECYVQNYSQDISCEKIQPSIEYIHQNYRNNDLTIKDVADQSFVSEVYFRKLFKEKYGISPQKYIINLRIQNAAGLISTGYYSLKEVAHMSGYNDYKYFSVEFKKTMGVSPSKYMYNFQQPHPSLQP